MGIYELRQKYGTNKKGGQALNAAVRAEIPGGGRLLDLTHCVRKRMLVLPPSIKEEMMPVLNELSNIRQEMLDAVASKYALASSKGENNEKEQTPGRKTSKTEKRTPNGADNAADDR